MSTLHFPKRFNQVVTQSFSGTDPKAWGVLAVAVCSLIAILALFFLR